QPSADSADRARRAQGRRRVRAAGRRPALPRRAGWPLAAGLALCLLAGAVSQGGRIADFGADAATGAGETQRLALADGSQVTLNTRTAVEDVSTANARGVRLKHGEAFFDVARDPARPFTVDAGPARIRVLGTHFNVRLLDSGAVAVAVEE